MDALGDQIKALKKRVPGSMSAKDGGIYSESTGQIVIHFQNPPALLKENLTAASLLLDNNDHILTAVKSLAVRVA